MEIDTGNTSWLLIATALVMLMTPGLAFFYGGLVRHKNVLGTIMHSFVVIAIVSVIWVVVGYSLAFGPDHWGLIGGLDWIGLRNVGLEPNIDLAPTVPHLGFMAFQMMFAVITPALITGAFAERAKFGSFLAFMVAWSILVYAPIAHWIWAPGGWLRDMGMLDFAGGTVIHVNAGMAALVAAILYGKRLEFGKEAIEPHDVSMMMLGVGLLWFGWFGFNAGSALSSGSLAVNAFVTTHISASAAAATWVIISWWHTKKATVTGFGAGAVAGLAGITQGAGFVAVMPAMLIGCVAGGLCYLAVQMRHKFHLDDSLDVVGVHGVGGIWGAIAVGLFATVAVNGAGKDGLFHGNPGQLGIQVLGMVVTLGYSLVATFAILKVIDWVSGLRVSEEEEMAGLDVTQHGERAYAYGANPFEGYVDVGKLADVTMPKSKEGLLRDSRTPGFQRPKSRP